MVQWAIQESSMEVPISMLLLSPQPNPSPVPSQYWQSSLVDHGIVHHHCTTQQEEKRKGKKTRQKKGVMAAYQDVT